MFDVEFSSFSRKFLKKSEKNIVERIIDRIEKLRSDPFPSDIKG